MSKDKDKKTQTPEPEVSGKHKGISGLTRRELLKRGWSLGLAAVLLPVAGAFAGCEVSDDSGWTNWDNYSDGVWSNYSDGVWSNYSDVWSNWSDAYDDWANWSDAYDDWTNWSDGYDDN